MSSGGILREQQCNVICSLREIEWGGGHGGGTYSLANNPEGDHHERPFCTGGTLAGLDYGRSRNEGQPCGAAVGRGSSSGRFRRRWPCEIIRHDDRDERGTRRTNHAGFSQYSGLMSIAGSPVGGQSSKSASPDMTDDH